MDAETFGRTKREGGFGNIFLIGSNIDGNETVVKEMYENGHIVGNHTFHHVEMTKLSDEKAMEEIRMTNEKISAITGEPVSFMRPPFGAWQKGLEKRCRFCQ